MLRLTVTIVICVLTQLMCAKITPSQESLAEKLDKLVEKVEKFTISPITDRAESLYAKLDRLNSLNPEKVKWPGDGLTDEEEELLSAMQQWGAVNSEQLAVLAKDLQEMREQPLVTNDKLPEEEVDDLWGEDFQDIQDDVETNYAMDGGEDWDTDEEEISTLMPRIHGQNTEVSSEIPKVNAAAGFRPGVLISSFIDPITATAERPKIIDDSSMTLVEQLRLKKAALANMGKVVRAARCLRPQPRWLHIRQLAPAADSIYMPPCVELHRCAPDSGCCDNEAEFCAPIDGKYVALPLFIKKSNGNLTVARMLFYNHTSCACISRDAPREPVLRMNTPEPEIDIERDDEPANLRTTVRELRCTCPRLFQAKIENDSCTCSCSWTESARRRECLSLAKGREHFGLKDRFCLSRGDCTVPTCEYGPYEIKSGRCPLRRYRRVRYHWKSPRYHDKN